MQWVEWMEINKIARNYFFLPKRPPKRPLYSLPANGSFIFGAGVLDFANRLVPPTVLFNAAVFLAISRRLASAFFAISAFFAAAALAASAFFFLSASAFALAAAALAFSASCFFFIASRRLLVSIVLPACRRKFASSPVPRSVSPLVHCSLVFQRVSRRASVPIDVSRRLLENIHPSMTSTKRIYLANEPTRFDGRVDRDGSDARFGRSRDAPPGARGRREEKKICASSRPTNVARRTSRARRISDGSDVRSAAASSRDIRLIIHRSIDRSIARRRKRASAEIRVVASTMIYLFTLVTTAVDLVALVALEATTAENASLDESAEASMESIGRFGRGVTIGRFVSIGRFGRSFRSFRSFRKRVKRAAGGMMM